MSKKEQLLNILTLLVVFAQQDYSTNEAAEDIFKLFNISDEEIEETSRRINYSGSSEEWIRGAKWYREQLKKKQL